MNNYAAVLIWWNILKQDANQDGGLTYAKSPSGHY